MKGFTLIETLVTTALFVLLVGLGILMSLDTYRGSVHRSERDTLVSALQRARGRAMANLYESPHGVCAEAGSYHIVCTDASDCPVETQDVIEGKGGTVTVSGVPDCSSGAITFAQLSGNLVGSEVSITVTEESRPDQEIIINEQGAIIW